MIPRISRREAAVVLAALLIAVLVAGIWLVLSRRHDQGPDLSGYRFDRVGRLVWVAGRAPIPCPPQAAGTIVVVAAGQSNAANFSGDRFKSRYPGRVLSVFAGRCYEAESPLLGADNIQGEIWTEVGNRLIGKGANRVVIVPTAIGGTAIDAWAPGGRLNREFVAAMRESPYRPTHIVWLQGEADDLQGTGTEAYRRDFASMVGSIRAAGIAAPLYVSIATRCERNPANPAWRADNPVARAQRLVVNGRDVLPGVDTDELVPLGDRYDGCHFGGRGAARVAESVADLLRP